MKKTFSRILLLLAISPHLLMHAQEIGLGEAIRNSLELITAGFSKPFLITPTHVADYTLTITIAGSYLVTDNLIFTPTGSMPAIEIATDGVTIDLNKKNLMLGAAVADVNGIQINAGTYGTVVKNGTISGMSNAGILAEESTSSLQIEDINIVQCPYRALEFLGTSSLSGISVAKVTNVNIASCGTFPFADALIHVSYGYNIFFESVNLSDNGSVNGNLSGIRFDNSSGCGCVNVGMFDTLGSSLTAFNFNNSSNNIVVLCNVLNSVISGSNASFIGFNVTNNSTANMFKNCILINNRSEQGPAIGYYFGPLSTGSIVTLAQIVNNTGTDFIGILLEGDGNPSTNRNAVLHESAILENKATTGNATGVFIRTSDKGVCKTMEIGNNAAPAGTAVGILFESGTGGNYWALRDCELFNNTGSSDGNSYGINHITGNNNVFYQNLATGNGLIGNNQLAGLPVSSVTQVNSQNLNSIMAPWTNLAVVVE